MKISMLSKLADVSRQLIHVRVLKGTIKAKKIKYGKQMIWDIPENEVHRTLKEFCMLIEEE